MKTRRILYPSDFSSASRTAFARAVDTATSRLPSALDPGAPILMRVQTRGVILYIVVDSTS